MGDRCSCVLYVRNPQPELLHILDDHLGEPEWADGERFGFDEVNYAQLPNEVQIYLRDHRIPFAWHNEPGDEYGEGVLIFDGGEATEWLMSRGQIVLTISEAENPEIRQQARYWQGVWDGIA